MSTFLKQLKQHNPTQTQNRRWLFVPYDQLTDQLGPLAKEDPNTLGIILIENMWKGKRRPYHKQKLAWILCNLRHFAIEQAQRGVAVQYHFHDGPYADKLADLAQTLGTIDVMNPAEYELRQDLSTLNDTQLRVLDHEGWMTSPEWFLKSQGKRKQWRMDAFYRYVRKQTGILMEDGSPIGGKYSFDADNRQPWDGTPEAPAPPTWTPDDITREVGECIESRFADHPGTLDLTTICATAEDAERFWAHIKHHCMVHFGPYEDAMSSKSRTLFHTLISPLLNLHRLLPARVVRDVEQMDIPLNSKEGFIRQVLGWREFMKHVHDQTDGLRHLPEHREDPPRVNTPGDAGWSAYLENHQGKTWQGATSDDAFSANAAPSILNAHNPLPAAFWGEASGLFCLDHVVASVMETGYSHHIERLMVLGNLATLLDIEPRTLTDWFWVCYIDAFDWVVEPNVLGMATFGVGELFTTKPYVAGSNYTNKMSNFCTQCAFSPTTTCPITHLYWAFLSRNQTKLQDNNRLGLIYGNLKRRSDAKKQEDERVFDCVKNALEQGKKLTPTTIKAAKSGQKQML